MHNRHTLGLLKIPYLYYAYSRVATLEYYAHTVTYYSYYTYSLVVLHSWTLCYCTGVRSYCMNGA